MSIEDQGQTLHLLGNAWKSLDFDYQVTANTILEFDFMGEREGEIHAIGFDSNHWLTPRYMFQILGTQDWGRDAYDGLYDGSEGQWMHYRINVGEFYTGQFDRLVFANDHDVRVPTAESLFRNVSIHEMGSQSGENLQYEWTQTDGPLVELINADSATPQFVAPELPGDATLTFQVTVTDGKMSGTDIVTVLVAADNDPPLVRDDSGQTLEDLDLDSIDVLLNDTDVDSALSVASFTQAGHGTVTSRGDGTFHYAPDSDYFGADSFTYTVTDGGGNQATATVSIVVEPQQDPPAAWSGAVTVDEDHSVDTPNVLANSTDADGDALSLIAFTPAANGQVVSNGDGTFTYTPATDFQGTDSFTYSITDGQGNTDVGTISITVVPGQDAPVAWSEMLNVTQGQSVTSSDVLANSTDPDGDTLNVLTFTAAANGQVAYNQHRLASWSTVNRTWSLMLAAIKRCQKGTR
jgi:hypothetical protein